MREDCELACDADTLSFLKPEEYQSYGLSIISLVTPAQSSWRPGTTGFFGNKNNFQIKRRIKMIKFFHKPTSKWSWTVVVIFISLGLIGFTNSISNATSETGTPLAGLNKPLEAKSSSAVLTQVQTNKMIHDDWDMCVTNIKFYPMLDASKQASIYFAFTNRDGLDKDCVLEGKIVGIIGTSGKLYDVSTDDTLDQVYNFNKSLMKKRAEQNGKSFVPGKFEFAIDFSADGAEENFAKVIFQDKNGNNFEIPIQGIVPELLPASTTGK
jgi:hypothetical protein